MIQLSNFYKNDMDLRVKYMSPELGISELYTLLIDKSPVDLPDAYKQKMRALRTRYINSNHIIYIKHTKISYALCIKYVFCRLTPEAEDLSYAEKLQAETFAVSESSHAPKAARLQHIMISYSKDYKKELVVDLELSLRDLG